MPGIWCDLLFVSCVVVSAIARLCSDLIITTVSKLKDMFFLATRVSFPREHVSAVCWCVVLIKTTATTEGHKFLQRYRIAEFLFDVLSSQSQHISQTQLRYDPWENPCGKRENRTSNNSTYNPCPNFRSFFVFCFFWVCGVSLRGKNPRFGIF